MVNSVHDHYNTFKFNKSKFYTNGAFLEYHSDNTYSAVMTCALNMHVEL